MNIHRILFVTICLFLSACSTVTAPDFLVNAREAFWVGDYNRVIRIVATSPELGDASDEQRIEARKLAAFSYCVMRQANQGQQQFRAILEIDPEFELGATEKEHPDWGPVFATAKKNFETSRK